MKYFVCYIASARTTVWKAVIAQLSLHVCRKQQNKSVDEFAQDLKKLFERSYGRSMAQVAREVATFCQDLP